MKDIILMQYKVGGQFFFIFIVTKSLFSHIVLLKKVEDKEIGVGNVFLV